MKMRAFVVWLALLVLLTAASQAQNLLTNGDFESAALSPWTVTSGSVTIVPDEGASGFWASASSGTIAQTISTEAGATYRISFRHAGGGSTGTFTVSATPTGTATPDGTKIVKASDGNFHGFNFVATTQSTVISVNIFASGRVGGATGWLDDITVNKLEQRRLTGRYRGTFTKQFLLPELGLTQKLQQKIVADVDSLGRIVILRDASEVAADQIFPDGTFSIRFGSTTVRTGAALVKGRRIEIAFEIPGTARRDDFNEVIETETKFTYLLTRQSPAPPK